MTAGTIRAIFHQFPHAEIFLLDYGKERKAYVVEMNGKRIVVPLENIRFSKKVYLSNNVLFLLLLSLAARLVPFDKLKGKLISRNACLKRLSESSIVTSLAGGDSFSDIYGFWRFVYVSLPQLLAVFMGKRLVLLPQTIGPFKGSVVRHVARYILKRAEIIYARDYESLEEARHLLGSVRSGNGKIRFCYDLGFVLDPARPRKMNLPLGVQQRKWRPVIGLNISGLMYMGGYARNNSFKLRIDYPELIVDLIDFMIRKKNATLMLVPHVFGTDGESDPPVCERIYSSLKERYGWQLLAVDGTFHEGEIKHIIGLCEFFIGSRMHACIAALSQNIPAVAIAYSRKFRGVMKTIGMESLVADPRKLDKEEIFRVIDGAFERRAFLRGCLEEKLPSVKETVLNLFLDIDCLREAE